MKDVFENCSLNSILKNISMSSFISTMKRQFKKQYSSGQVKVVSEPERIDVFLTRICVQVTDISCGVVYEATLASPVLFRSYRYVNREVESFVVF